MANEIFDTPAGIAWAEDHSIGSFRADGEAEVRRMNFNSSCHAERENISEAIKNR